MFKFGRNLKNKITKDTVVLITGACQGLGKELALLFAKRNQCRIIVLDKAVDLSDKVITELQFYGADAKFYECDIGNPDQIENVLNNILNTYTHVDILVNNAGVFPTGFFLNNSMEDIENTHRVNFLGPVRIIKKILPVMIQNNTGHIVTVGSIGSFFPSPLISSYSSSKHAIYAFHESLRYELGIQSLDYIKATIVCQWAMNTNMIKDYIDKFGHYFPMYEPSTIAAKVYDGIIHEKKNVIVPKPIVMFGRLIYLTSPHFILDPLIINATKLGVKLFGDKFKKID